ncbi:unnamed protein product [Mytilus edulis]|uniref:Fucolectin tachylectin-4 pentraxin-1 domain-containing protein n=1 Tax=Mytilus edulis TaxID=6550 RepID=A0A8S3S508_MYTED|nr:unnamed protein product [Mytilus edulis]
MIISGNGSMNIAFNKNATQVSTFNDNVSRFGPMNANNGKKNQVATNGDCTHTTDKDPAKWWTVDFGNMYTIESVHIYARKDCCLERHSDFEIRIHNTSDWSSQFSLCYKQIGQAPTELYVNCTDHLSGKYLTVYKKDDYHHYPLTLCEVEVYGNEVTGKTVNTNALKPTTEITTITNQIRQMTTNTRNNYDIQPKENMNMCLCKRSANDIYQQQNHNYSKEERQFLINERIKILQKELKIDKSKLSSTRRKNTCAEDDRRSSQHLGFIGIIVLVSIMGCIVLSDLVDLIRFINKPRCRWCMRKRKKKK